MRHPTDSKDSKTGVLPVLRESGSHSKKNFGKKHLIYIQIKPWGQARCLSQQSLGRYEHIDFN